MKHTAKVLALLLSLVLVLAGLASCDLFKEVDDKPADTVTEQPDTGTKPSEKPTDPSTDEPGTDEPTPSDIVEIGTAEEFLAAVAKINTKADGYETKTLKLTADIALSGDFTPISGFKGTFDGQFHKITGLDVAADTAAVGLFATLEGATVRNLIIEGAQAANGAPDSALGILAGAAKDAVVEAVTVSGTVTAGGKAIAGGLFGTAEATKILNVSVTVTVNGTGTKAGGVVGAMLGGATISAGYVDATVNVTGAAAGTVAGTKTNDSAVAFVLMKSGEAVGKVEGLEFLPSYIIACKTGLDAKADMGWSTVDWDVSGEVPVLVKNTEKTHAAPKVTVDGTEVAAAWGEKIAEGLSKPADQDFVATVGYGLGGEAWYEGLPVLGDLALEKLTVDYSDLIMVGDPVDFTQPELIVLDTVTLGEEALTRVWAAEKKIGDYTGAVLYLSSASGKIYSISLEESTVAGLPAGALNFVLRNLTDNTSAEYCAFLTMHCGAWEKDGEVLVFDGYATEKDGKNLYRVMNVTAGTVEFYTPYYVLKDGKPVLCMNGFAESDAGLEKDGAVWEVSVSYFDGEWVSTDGEKLVFADGKVNGLELKKEIHPMLGATLTYTDDKGVTYTLSATANGLMRTNYAAGSVTNFANNRFSGTYVSLVDGKLTTIRIEGNRVWVNDAATALTGILGVDGSVPTFTVKIGEATYQFRQNGAQLTDANGVVYAADTDLAKFVGTWILGSEKFVIANGSVTVGEKKLALTLSYANGAYSLTGGEMTFAFNGSNLTVAGYASPVTNDSSVRKLWTPAQANVFFGTFKHLYVAVNSSAKYEWHTIELKNGVLTIDGEVYAFEIATASYTGTMQVLVQYGTNWAGDPAVATLTPNGDLLTLGNLGMSMGYGAVPSTLQDVIGRYYQFLYGTGEEGETVGEIRLDVDGTLTVGGKAYNYGEYEMVVLGGKVIVTFTAAEGETQTVTFSNKTAVWSADAENTYMNYDRLLPDGNKYIVVGKDTDETLEVIKGNLGHTEIIPAEDEDEDDEEVWVDAVFPLYGFRYTVGGKTYTTTKFTWTRVSSGRATMILTLKAEDGAVTYIQVGYDPASDCSSITIMSNGSTSEAHSSEQLGGFAGEYTDGKDKFSVDEEGVFKMNGDRVGYIPTFNFESGIYSFFVNGKTYTIDAARREIATADGDIFYDGRVFNYAGIKLIAFSVIGEGTYQRDYALELTPEGWKFAGELVDWQNYDGFRFNTEIGGETITWRPNSGTFDSAVYSFCISLYPNATLNPELGESGWANRYFVPELLADNTGLYAGLYGTGEMDVFSIKAPVLDGNSFTSFTFTINSTEYLHSAFTMYMEDGALKLSFDDGDKVISLKPVEGGTELTINGAPVQDYVQPDMTGFATENQFAFGGTNQNLDFIQIEVDENGKATWTYALGKGEYSQKTGENFGFGEWRGETIVFVQPTSYKGFAVVRMDGKVWVIYQEIFSLVLNPLTTPDGKTLTFDFVVEDGALKLVGEIDGEAITDIEQRDANYDFGGSNHAYIKYTFGGEDYAVALNCDAETAKMHPAVVLTLDEMNFCYHENLTTGLIYFAPVYDEETGAGVMRMLLKVYGPEYQPDSFEPTEEDASIYKLVYTVDGTTYTDYVKFFFGAVKEKGLKVIKGDFFPMLGEHKLGDETITVTFELDEKGVPQYYLTIGGVKYLASVGTAKLSTEVGDYTYTLTVANGIVTAASVKTSWLVYDNSSSYYSYSMADGTTGSAKVALEGAAFKVTFNGADATNAVLAEDESYLAFTGADGKNYRIYITNASSFYKGVIVTEAQAAFLGNHASEKLEIALTQTSSWSAAKLEVKYDGSAVTNVVYHSGTLMTFEVGGKVYAAELTADGVKVTPDVLDLSAEENQALAAYLGSYTTDTSNKIVVGYTVTGTVGAYEAKFYVTLDGAEATLTVNEAKGNIVNITSGETVKHYAFYSSGYNKAFVEVSEDLYNLLGTTKIGEIDLTVSVTVSYRSSKYSLSTSYKIGDASAVSSSKTFGDLTFTKLTCGGKTYFLYVSGDTKVLQEISDADAKIADMSSKTVKVGDTTYTLKGNVTFADGAFAVGYVFGTGSEFTPVTLTAVEGVEGAWSFTYGGATYYYLTSGSYAYVVTAADYALYGEKTYGDVTLKFTWGSSQLMVAVKGADENFGTAVKVELLNDGAKDYQKFTVNGKTYILAKDKFGNDVLTDATNIGSDLKHFKNFTFKGYSTPKVRDLDDNVIFSTFEAIYKIGDDGKPVFIFKLGDTLVTEYVELDGGEVLKMKVGDAYRFFAIAVNYAPDNRYYVEDYQMIEITEAQAAIFGKTLTTADGIVYTILGKGSSWGKNQVLVYVGTTDKPYAANASAALAADGSLTFTYGGVNYKAAVKDGALTVEVVTD